MSAYKGQKYRERKPLPLIGLRFTRLLVKADLGLRSRGTSKLRTRWWLCECDCGNTTETTTANLRNGSTHSCGCYGVERRRDASIAALTKHGHALSKGGRRVEYNVFKTMHARCYNPNNEKYPSYGGRGIVVEQRWHNYENFYADMGDRPSSTHQIERRDNDGNYGPANCYWATAKQQARNRRSNCLVTISGQTRCVAEWAEASGVGQATLLARVNAGWPEHRLLIPTNTRKSNAVHK